MTIIYCDTSFLFSLYIDCQFTLEATQTVKKLQAPLMLNVFQKFELTNAIMRNVFMKVINREQASHLALKVEEDIDSGVYQFDTALTPSVYSLAQELSHKHTPQMGNRALDILHVACASLMKASHFITFDKRQIALAKAEGMDVAL